MEGKYIEMHIDDMKQAKMSWKKWLKTARGLLRKIQQIEETKANRWDLKSLEMSYSFFIDEMGKIVTVYSMLIDLAEDCELTQDDFLNAMKGVQLINNELRKEYNKKTFTELNNKYVHGIQEAIVLTCL